jgi:3-hydroxyisobutyrate dehydrogenase
MNIGFVGLGNMGLPMASNLLRASHRIAAYDVSPAAIDAAKKAGIRTVSRLEEVAEEADAIITMLPAGADVRKVYLGDGGLVATVSPRTLLIDTSTIEVEVAREVGQASVAAGIEMIDAPVSGGTGGAKAGTLTFIVGGSAAAVERAKPILQAMGKNVGPTGHGQAAKQCNNMVAATSLIAVCEAFAMAERIGLDSRKLFDVMSTSSAKCAVLLELCPAPNVVPDAPANRRFSPGFRAALMLKDLRLAQRTASAAGASTPLGALATELYALYCGAGNGGMDESGIFTMIRGEQKEGPR